MFPHGACPGASAYAGTYASEIEAAIAFDSVAWTLAGRCAVLNFPRRDGKSANGVDTESETDSDSGDEGSETTAQVSSLSSVHSGAADAPQPSMRVRPEDGVDLVNVMATPGSFNCYDYWKQRVLAHLAAGGNGDSIAAEPTKRGEFTPTYPASLASGKSVEQYELVQVIGGALPQQATVQESHASSFASSVPSAGVAVVCGPRLECIFAAGCVVAVTPCPNSRQYLPGPLASLPQPNRMQRLFRGYHAGPVTALVADATGKFVVSACRRGGSSYSQQATVCVW